MHDVSIDEDTIAQLRSEVKLGNKALNVTPVIYFITVLCTHTYLLQNTNLGRKKEEEKKR